MEARDAPKRDKTKKSDDPADSKTEQRDVVGAFAREEVDIKQVPGASEAGDQILEIKWEEEVWHQAIVTIVLKRVKSRLRQCSSLLSSGSDMLKSEF